jgi:hypothetical protein
MWLFMFPLVLQLPSILVIDLGEHVTPIVAQRLTLAEPAPEEGAFLTRRDWVRVRAALKSSRAVCGWAVNEAIGECVAGVARDRELTRAKITTLTEVADSYATRLTTAEEALASALSEKQQLKTQRDFLLWSTIGVSVATAAFFVGALLIG